MNLYPVLDVTPNARTAFHNIQAASAMEAVLVKVGATYPEYEIIESPRDVKNSSAKVGPFNTETCFVKVCKKNSRGHLRDVRDLAFVVYTMPASQPRQ